MRKLLVAAAAALAAAVPSPAAAGGWAVTSLDPMAVVAVAGEPFDVGFTIRQHGVTPVAVDGVAIVVTDTRGTPGSTARFGAVAEGPVGHYVASVEFPASGRFDWAVEQGWFGRQDLGTIEVHSDAAAVATDGARGASGLTAPLLAVAALVGALGLFDLGRSTAGRRAAA